MLTINGRPFATTLQELFVGDFTKDGKKGYNV